MGNWLTRLIGNRGERAAARFLRQAGMKILARQQSSRFGEIDLVARDGETIVFVEVKTRSSLRGGQPEDAVTRKKQERLTRTALVWLKQRGLLNLSSRFDVIAVYWPEQSRQPELTHYRNAFEPAGPHQY